MTTTDRPKNTNPNIHAQSGKYLSMQTMLKSKYNTDIVLRRKAQIRTWIFINIHAVINGHIALTK